MVEMRSRWAVQVEGHEATITRIEAYLAASLQQRTDTFISRLREVPVLRSQLWDAVENTDIVQQLAQTELALLEGLTKLAGGASPLNVGTVFELGTNDVIIRQTRRSVNSVYGLSDIIDPPPLFRHRMDAVRASDALAGAVIELSGKADWIKIYKTVEYLEEHFGGEAELGTAFPARRRALKRIKRTAQSVRHRARAFARISRPYKLEEAEKFLQTLLREIIGATAARGAIAPPAPFEIPHREYPAEQQIGLYPLILVNGERSEVAFVGDALSISRPDASE